MSVNVQVTVSCWQVHLEVGRREMSTYIKICVSQTWTESFDFLGFLVARHQEGWGKWAMGLSPGCTLTLDLFGILLAPCINSKARTWSAESIRVSCFFFFCSGFEAHELSICTCCLGLSLHREPFFWLPVAAVLASWGSHGTFINSWAFWDWLSPEVARL